MGFPNGFDGAPRDLVHFSAVEGHDVIVDASWLFHSLKRRCARAPVSALQSVVAAQVQPEGADVDAVVAQSQVIAATAYLRQARDTRHAGHRARGPRPAGPGDSL